jgi:UDP-N-acetyl-D-glucosamine dehydrogenase
VVGTWQGETSSPLSGADISIVVTLHSVVKVAEVLASARYVFDTTGKVTGAKTL